MKMLDELFIELRNVLSFKCSTTVFKCVFYIIWGTALGLWIKVAYPLCLNKWHHFDKQTDCVYALTDNPDYDKLNEKEREFVVVSARGTKIFKKFREALFKLDPSYTVPPLNVVNDVVKFGHLNAVNYAGHIYVTQDLMDNPNFSDIDLITILMHEYGHFVHDDLNRLCYTKTAVYKREYEADDFAAIKIAQLYGPYQSYVKEALSKIARYSAVPLTDSESHPSMTKRIALLDENSTKYTAQALH